MRWLLDDGPFHLLASHVDATWTWPEGQLVVVREVADGASKDRSGRRQRLLSVRSPTGGSSITVHDGGEAASKMLWEHLRPDSAKATRDIGEDVSLAVCATELPDATFVTMDKRPAYLALAELGRARVATPFDLWDWLEQHGHIGLQVFRELCKATVKSDQGLPGIPLRHRR